jgi:hypothetical protein
MPNLAYLLIEHPLGGIRPDRVREKAFAAVDALQAALMGRA